VLWAKRPARTVQLGEYFRRTVTIQRLRHPEHFRQNMVHPQTGGCTQKQVIVIGKMLPDPGRIGFHRGGIPGTDAQLLQADTLAVKHTQQIVIGLD
jgi:hypothetical protein